MSDFKNYINKVIELYDNQDKKSILSAEIRNSIGLENNGKLWATLAGYLVTKGILEKSDIEPKRKNGKPVFFYKLGKNANNNKNIIKSYVIIDQFGSQHFYENDTTLDKDLEMILSKNGNLKLTVYKPVKTAQNKAEIIDVDSRL